MCNRLPPDHAARARDMVQTFAGEIDAALIALAEAIDHQDIARANLVLAGLRVKLRGVTT